MISGADKEYLRKFIPLSELSNDNFNELVSKIMVEALPAGGKLFSKGDRDNFSYYLLKGEVVIIDADGRRSELTAESQQSYYPLEHNQPRKKSIHCKTDIQYFKVVNNLLDILLTWDQNKNYIVNEFGNDTNETEIDDNDWMTRLLQLEIFHKIPAANIQTMFQKIESISVKKDDVIIKQVKRIAQDKKKIMIILDSNHTHEHVLTELNCYSPLVTKDSYLVVMDTVVDDMPDDFFSNRPWGKGNNPKTAVREFLKTNDRFTIDKSLENKLLITVAPDGYLKCIKD